MGSEVTVVFSGPDGQFSAAFAGDHQKIAAAASAAIADAGAYIKSAGRGSIAAAGFSGQWQNALRVDFYPASGKPSANAALFVHHAIPYASIFEYGGTVGGKPLLWLPLPQTPKFIGGRKMTARLYAQQIGHLKLVQGRGHPLLIGKSSEANPPPKNPVSRGRPHTLSALHKGARVGGVEVPLFIGLDSVTIGKKFDISGVCRTAFSALPALYFSHLENG